MTWRLKQLLVLLKLEPVIGINSWINHAVFNKWLILVF